MRLSRSGLGAALVFVAACHRAPAPQPSADGIWSGHEHVVVEAIQGHQYREHELIEAVEFFEATTGIKAPDALDEQGTVVVPTKAMPGALAKWRQWYSENRDRLRVDTATKKIRVGE